MEQKSSYYKKHWINKFDLLNCKTNNAQDIIKNKFLDHYPIHYTDDTHNYDQVKQYKNQSEYVWLVDQSITVLKTFPWWFKPSCDSQETVYRFPYVFKQSRRIKDWTKVQLVATDLNKVRVSKQRYICGEYDPYRGKEKFDIFYLNNSLTTTSYYDQLKSKFPSIVLITDISEALEKSTTDMFWLVPDDVIVEEQFDFSYEPDEWSYNYCHMFQNNNKKSYDGIVLIPKSYIPTGREIVYRHFASKKLVTVLASKSKKYDKFVTLTYEDFCEAQQSATTPMFWIVPTDVEIDKDFDFSYQVPKWDQQYIHLFLNGDSYNGVVLFPKNTEISKREFENRFYQNTKEIPVVASKPMSYVVYYSN